MRYILRARLAEIWDYDQESLIICARLECDGRVRQLRTRRHLLEIPTKKRFLFWEKLRSFEPFTMPFAENIVIVPFFCGRSDLKLPSDDAIKSGSLLSVTRTSSVLDKSDISFLGLISTALREVAIVMHRRELRAKHRRQSLQRVCALCTETGDDAMSADDLHNAVAAQIVECLPGANVSVGDVRPGGDEIRLLGAVELRSAHNPLFDCLPPTLASSSVVRDPRTPLEKVAFEAGVRVEVRYGKVWYPAALTKDRGHEMFDVVYDQRNWMGKYEKEAGVPVERIRIPKPTDPLFPPSALLLARSGHSLWPLIFVPLGKCSGVLCVDSWANEHDEPAADERHIVVYLQAVARHLGVALIRRARKAAASQLQRMILGTSQADRDDIRSTLVERLRDCILFAKSICVLAVAQLVPNSFPLACVEDAATAILRCSSLSENINDSAYTNAFMVGRRTIVCAFDDCDVRLDERAFPEIVRIRCAVICS